MTLVDLGSRYKFDICIHIYIGGGLKQPGTLGTNSEMHEAADSLAQPPKNIVFGHHRNFKSRLFLSKNRMMLVYNLCKLVYI